MRQAFDDAVRELVGGLLIHTAISKATGVPITELTPQKAANLLADPTVHQRFETLREQDETLRGVMDSQFDRVYKEFLNDLFQGNLTLGLFTAEELMLLSVLIYRQRQLAKSGPEPSDEKISADEAFQAAQQAVQTLNTPERQQHWRACIAQQLEAGEELSGPRQAALFLFRETLTEPVEDEALMPLLIAAYLGEFRLQQERAEADPALNKELEEAYARILERLERGEPPLAQAPPCWQGEH